MNIWLNANLSLVLVDVCQQPVKRKKPWKKNFPKKTGVYGNGELSNVDSKNEIEDIGLVKNNSSNNNNNIITIVFCV